MKTVLCRLLFLALIVCAIGGCAKKDPDKFQVGVVMSLTGPGSEYGKMIMDGMQVALLEANKNVSPFKIELIVEDDKTEPASGVSAAEKLIQANKVKVVLGPIASSVALAVAPVCERNKVVMLSPAASTPKLSDAGEFIFRIYPSDSYDGFFLASYSADSLKLTNASVIYLNNEFGVGLSNSFGRRLEELGGHVDYAEAFNQGATDFRSQIAKVKSAKSQVLFLIATVKEYTVALRQMKQLGLKIQVLAPITFDDPSIISSVGDAADGVIYSRPFFDPSRPDSTLQRFVKSFDDQFHKKPSVLNALGFDAMNVVHKVLLKYSFAADSLRSGLMTLKDFPGAAGNITFDKNGDVLKELQLVIVKDKNAVPISEVPK